MARKKKSEPTELLIVNDVPGEECRIAIVQDGHLEELYSERTATATSVGNIYIGRVTNVESAIQAAFVDFGEGQNGFLHVSDLHPRFFPGAGRTEKVGRKIPRRERPPIQECLKRGQEIMVQVLKEGIGTKGPTLTSYLSIPGRLLVAMPFMDKVGVSRKVEDDDQRREMRKVLDEVELPEGFGFILRTAGMGRSKTDIKRDVAYLMRLWKAMEKRRKTESAPCELYTESDLLIRTIRDVLRPSINAIVVDSEDGYQRAENFVRVVTPRSAPKVLRYTRPGPIFHTFDIERQLDLIHSREVPLKSGGSIVIEQTEALVAIDVNSGRSLRARDSETNAYETNCEAVDEICRQLRLRDLGGLIINDLIDMRASQNRRRIEERVRENLKRDRARATALRISEFGILEMTRQRMRPSMRKAHFVTCPHCHGHGEIMSPESVATNAVRQIGYLLQYPQIERVEIVCSPRVASVILSSKRRALVRLEDESGKKVDVRVSDAIAADRIDFYSYDERNADVDMSRLTPFEIPSLKLLEQEHQKLATDNNRGVKSGQFTEDDDDLIADDQPPAASETSAQDGQSTKKKRRRRRRKSSEQDAADSRAEQADTSIESDVKESDDAEKSSAVRKKRRRRSRRRSSNDAETQNVKESDSDSISAKHGSADEHSEPEMPASESPDSAKQASIRVHTLAKEIGVPSSELIQRAGDADDIHVKNHMSTVTHAQAKIIRDWFNDDVSEAARRNEGVVDQTSERKSGRRRRSRRRSRRQSSGSDAQPSQQHDASTSSDQSATTQSDSVESDPSPIEQPDASTENPKKRESRRRGKKRSSRKDHKEKSMNSQSNSTESSNARVDESGSNNAHKETSGPSDGEDTRKKKSTRRRQRKKTTKDAAQGKEADEGRKSEADDRERGSGSNSAQPAKELVENADLRKPRRSVYAGRRRLKPSELPSVEQME